MAASQILKNSFVVKLAKKKRYTKIYTVEITSQKIVLIDNLIN
jgi:hypothetical protein